jgi:hypothetical protein
VRELGPADGSAAGVHWRYLISAAYPSNRVATPLRALVGQPAPFGGRATGLVPVAGRRALAWPRVGGAAGLLLAAALAAVLGLRHATPGTAAVQASGASAPAATAMVGDGKGAAAVTAAKVTAAETAGVATGVAAPASAAASAAAAVAGTAAEAAAPAHSASAATAAHEAASAPVQPEPAGAEPAHSEHAQPEPAATHPATQPGPAERPAAAAEAPAVERPLPKPRPTIRPIHAPPVSMDATTQASAKANGRSEPATRGLSFALVTAVSANEEPLVQLRRRLRQAMGREGEELKLELQPAPGGQVLALWPIPSRDSATRLADTLRLAGIRMRLVEF